MTWCGPERKTLPFEEWDGGPPVAENYMPYWPENERTHYQMYETTSEGTPISPVMKRPEELARWLVKHKASACGCDGATYEEWLSMIIGSGWAPTMVKVNGTLISGVSFVGKKEEKDDTASLQK
jgi:hypothetical protein